MSVSSQPTAAAPDAEAIWREFHDRLFAFINRRVPSRETAEDILQDVMLRIHRHAEDLERADAVGAWIHGIARNAIADHYRSAKVRRERPAGIGLDGEGAAETETESDVRGELSACVASLLERVPATHREALRLTEIEGLTQATAAERLGISHSGMKSRVQRGRAQLKQVLTDCCEIERDRRGGLTAYRPRNGACGCGED
jgi:RNA polymerase sigma-70 factor (ECF subfamily)